jgi:N-acetyl-anhydromuramyl-L-alanine amidase AmpD
MLPRYCYPGRELENPEAIVIHFFSAINVKPEKWDDPETCWELFRELNLAGGDRGIVLPKSSGSRGFASAHYMIGRDGKVYKLLADNLVAYHAGESEWNGRKGLNEWSIGIELIGHITSDYTEEQYQALQLLCAQLMSKHGIKVENIIGHEHVSPGRKIDPGPLFDWDRLEGGLRSVVPFA